MKKVLILMLVLGMFTAANAAFIEFRNVAGTATITTIGTGQAFSVVIGGTVAGDLGDTLRLYDSFESFGGTDYFDFDGVGQQSAVTANMGDAVTLGSYSVTFDGYESINDDPFGPGTLPNPSDGDWFIALATAGTNLGTATAGLINSGYTAFLITDTLSIVPEPMTIALLGLGGLFLRRRK